MKKRWEFFAEFTAFALAAALLTIVLELEGNRMFSISVNVTV